jgi:hypothetical protein
MKKISFLFFFLSVLTIHAKSIKDSTQVRVMQVLKNGVDITPSQRHKKLDFILFSDSLDMMRFCIVSKANHDISYGKVYDYTEKITAASDSSFKFKVVDFVWPYRNSWDKYSETVIVKIVFTFNDAAVMVKCSLKSENEDVMEYNGFVRGSINRDVWKE